MAREGSGGGPGILLQSHAKTNRSSFDTISFKSKISI